MGPLFIPPLIVKLSDFNFDLKKVKRVYFQFYFDTSDGNKRFRLIAYAIGPKRKRDVNYKPIKLDIDEKKLTGLRLIITTVNGINKAHTSDQSRISFSRFIN